jgi:hypothetical protein
MWVVVFCACIIALFVPVVNGCLVTVLLFFGGFGPLEGCGLGQVGFGLAGGGERACARVLAVIGWVGRGAEVPTTNGEGLLHWLGGGWGAMHRFSCRLSGHDDRVLLGWDQPGRRALGHRNGMGRHHVEPSQHERLMPFCATPCTVRGERAALASVHGEPESVSGQTVRGRASADTGP